MRVVIVAPVHPWDDIRVFHKEAKTLASVGHEVVLIARAPNSTTIDDIRIIAVPNFRLRFVRFAMLPWVLFVAMRYHGDVYHLHNPDTIPVAVFLKAVGKRVVYDTHEDFSQRILIRKWIPGFLRPLIARAVTWAEGFVGSIADIAIGTQSNVTDRLGKRALLIENAPWADSPAIRKALVLARSIDSDDCFRLVYAGAWINEYRGLFTMIEAVRQINSTVRARLWLIGRIQDDDLRKASQTAGWEFVDHLDYMPLEQAYAHISKSDVGLLVIQDVADHRCTSPNKLYEYQMLSVPFVASAFERWVDQLSPIESGCFVDPSNLDQIVEKLVWLSQHTEERKQMAERGHAFISQCYNWESESSKLLHAYEKIMK